MIKQMELAKNSKGSFDQITLENSQPGATGGATDRQS